MHMFLACSLSQRLQRLEYTHLIKFPLEGMASIVGADFCFLVNVDDNVSSGFLFFISLALVCLSHKLRGAVSVGIVPGSCVLGLGPMEGPIMAGGRELQPPSMDVTFTVLDSVVPTLSTTQGCCNGGGAGAFFTDATLLSVWGVVSVVWCMTEIVTSTCVIGHQSCLWGCRRLTRRCSVSTCQR
jgi:hypothetical protein